MAAASAHGAAPLIERLDAGQHQTIVVYGTSLTAGGTWVSQLTASLNAVYPGQITWVNSGLSGKASNSGVASLNASVLSKNPDAVFIEFAMNDAFTAYPPADPDFGITLAQSQANLNSMIDSVLAQNSSATVVLQTMNPSWDAPNGNQSGSKRPQLAQYYQGYRDVAAARGLTLVDNFAVWQKVQANTPAVFQSYVADGTHPSAAGYSQFVTPAIRSALGVENGLTLLIDPNSGRAVLQNQSKSAINVISYTISSGSGALLASNWDSLHKHGNDAWFEANPQDHNLSELNPVGSLSLAPWVATSLGAVWNASKALDVTLIYQTPEGLTKNGAVVYTSAAATMALPGDFNADGAVDGGDFLYWQRTFGASVLAFTGADHTGDRFVDSRDLAAWQSDFVGRVAIAAQAVPEPAASYLAAAAASVAMWRQRHGRAVILGQVRVPKRATARNRHVFKHLRAIQVQ